MMLNSRNKGRRTKRWNKSSALRPAAPPKRPGDKASQPLANESANVVRGQFSERHPLANAMENTRLYAYENSVKEAFDAIVPALKKISALQHEYDFETQAQRIAQHHMGFELPEALLADAWVDQLDMRSLFAWCVFETYHRFCDEVFTRDPLGNSDEESRFQSYIQECGFHKIDVSPCADGRLAHVIRYVLRLPYKAVRRRSYAGAMFDIDDSLDKWVRTELDRYREGLPNTADEPTQYLKAVVYHHSSVDPEHEGCAAHGSDTRAAAQGGLDKLNGFREAVENTYCCGASIDCLLIGMDTDTDGIRVHLTNADGEIDLDNYIDSLEVYDVTSSMSAGEAEQWVENKVRQQDSKLDNGMIRFVSHLIRNNLSQVEYVRNYYGGHYSDIGHAERFIGAGIGFEEIQLRNLTFFAYLNTVEEATADLDVGVKIFTGLNVSHGLPVPIVVRYDYHGNVPGARERAEEHCQRVAGALHDRYRELSDRGLLHTLQVVRDINAAGRIEILDCSVKTTKAGAH